MERNVRDGVANAKHPSMLGLASSALDTMLSSRALFASGRILITFMYWYAGLGFLLNFSGAVQEMRSLGIEHSTVVTALTIAIQLAGSWLIIDGRLAWLGAGMLGVFTLATIPVDHPFWTMTGAAATQARLESEEHLTVVGGLILLSILCHREFKPHLRDASPGA
jgi:transmembrane protein